MAELRPARPDDAALLRELTHVALFVPPGGDPFPVEIVDRDELVSIHRDFGTHPGDVGVVAVDVDRPVGAAWARLGHGVGYVNDRTPELAIAVDVAHRGRGLGTALLAALLDEAVAAHHPALSLSVDDRNPALRLYQRFGFVEVRRDGHSVTMCRRLPGVGGTPATVARRAERHSAYGFCRRDDAVLLCRLAGTPLNSGWWTLPGGGLDPGETLEGAAIREIREETGLDATVREPLCGHQFEIRWRADDGTAEALELHQHVFRVEVGEGELRHELDNSTNLAAWVALDDLWRTPLVPIAVRGVQEGLRGDPGLDPRVAVGLHLAALRTRLPSVVMHGYAEEVEVRRGPIRYQGRALVERYVESVLARLGAGWLDVDEPEADPSGTVRTRWRTFGGAGHGQGGELRFEVRDGLIVGEDVRPSSVLRSVTDP